MNLDLSNSCVFEPADRRAATLLRSFERLVAASLVVAARSLAEGGVLVHGALAEREGAGVLLLGPSGRGKSTASRRLAPPWRSLSDDTALVVPGSGGSWRAHPWPTWSRFSNGGRGGSWEVSRGVPLEGLFFLDWAPVDRVDSVGPGRAACLLVESFEQAWSRGDDLFPAQTMRALRARAFENITALATAAPAFLLQISPDGPFWEKIEEALGAVRCAV